MLNKSQLQSKLDRLVCLIRAPDSLLTQCATKISPHIINLMSPRKIFVNNLEGPVYFGKILTASSLLGNVYKAGELWIVALSRWRSLSTDFIHTDIHIAQINIGAVLTPKQWWVDSWAGRVFIGRAACIYTPQLPSYIQLTILIRRYIFGCLEKLYRSPWK